MPSGTQRSGLDASAHVRRRQGLGLLLVAAILLLLVLFRAPAHVLFPPGWWRP